MRFYLNGRHAAKRARVFRGGLRGVRAAAVAFGVTRAHLAFVGGGGGGPVYYTSTRAKQKHTYEWVVIDERRTEKKKNMK